MGLGRLEETQPDVISAVTAAKKSIPKGVPYIDATAGVVCDPATGKPFVPDFYKRAVLETAKDNKANTYNFPGNFEFLERTAHMVFGENIKNIGMWPAAGGSHSISIGNNLLTKSMEEGGHRDVIIGTPTWPGHKGLITEAGGNIITYPHLDEHGGFNFDGFLETLENRLRENPEVTVLFHGVCQNPLGIDVPEKYWAAIAEKLLKDNITLQVDLAYLGFGKGIEDDSKMIRYFREKGVPMLVYFSGSKLYHGYGEDRIGAGFAANYANTGAIQANAIKYIRQTTSAIPERGQQIVNTIEGDMSDTGLRSQHRNFLAQTRERVAECRRIILNAVQGCELNYLSDSQGIFLQLPHASPEGAAGELFPELGEKMGWPLDNVQHDENVSRVATIPVGGEGVRLNLAALNSATAIRVAEAIGRVWQR